MRGPAPIVAAGTVLWRPARNSAEVEIALVHRPKYDDWSLPKGKRDPGEHAVNTAVRETAEETGYVGPLTRYCGHVRYPVAGESGPVPKMVSYWAMPALGGAFVPSLEVDEMVWLGPEPATARLTRAVDRGPIRRFSRLPARTSTLLLVRHARAGDRKSWGGSDAARPLDAQGLAQAAQVAKLAACFGVTSVMAADVVRCEQTVAPLAAALGVAVEPAHEVSETAHARRPKRAVEFLKALAARGGGVAVCSQGGVIPDVLEQLGQRALPDAQPLRSKKGSIWVLSFDGEKLVDAHYVDSEELAPS